MEFNGIADGLGCFPVVGHEGWVGALTKRVSRDTDTPNSACSSWPATFGGFQTTREGI
jgi:hypothetical protein